MSRARPTPRQLEVFATYCRSGSRKAAARELGLHAGGVDAHLGRLYAALEVESGLQAAAALGWLVPLNAPGG